MKQQILFFVNGLLGACSAYMVGRPPMPDPPVKPKYGPPHVTL